MSRRDLVDHMRSTKLTIEVPVVSEGLPPGVCFLESPLFHFHSNPWAYLLHVTRYFHLAKRIWEHFSANNLPSAAGTTLRILDIGCGYAEMLRFLQTYRRPAGYRLEYVGIDGDPTAVEIAKRIFPQCGYPLGKFTG